MTPLRNSSKARHSYFADSLKQQEPYKKQFKNIMKSSNCEVDELQGKHQDIKNIVTSRK